MSTRPRVAVIGLDSLSPVMAERFLASGHMPALQRLRERGLYAEMVPTMPPTTPAGWTTVATGAWPSTHGVEGFAVHRPGDPLDRKVHSLSSDASRAEFLWEAAERAGRNSVVVKFPMSWPSTGGSRLVQVDGAAGWGGMRCVWDLAPSGCWDTHPEAAAEAGDIGVGAPDWRTRDQDNLAEERVRELAVREPGSWEGLPAGTEPLWETALELPFGATVHALALRRGGREQVLLATARRWDERGLAGPGDWSPPLTVRGHAQGEVGGEVRLKVMAFDPAAARLRLYQGQVHQERGWTHPGSLAGELREVAGPFVEWTESYDRLQGWIDDATQLEIYEQHVDWLAEACRHLLRTRDWDLFLTQVHILDMAYHVYWGTIDPEHPAYDPARAGSYWELLGRVHALADRLVGAVTEDLDDGTLVMVMGEHGQTGYHTTLLTNHLLLREGLLALRRDRRTGALRIDWPATAAYASSYRIFLNVKGRDPEGAVAPAERHGLAGEIIELLRGVVDERTGRHPVQLAVREEDARGFGLYGPTMGDVVLATAPGYQSRTTFHLPPAALHGHTVRRREVPVLRPTRLFRDFTGEHDTSLPWARETRTVLVAAGAGVRPRQAGVPVRIVDVAATASEALGIDPPRGNEGNSMLAWMRRGA